MLFIEISKEQIILILLIIFDLYFILILIDDLKDIFFHMILHRKIWFCCLRHWEISISRTAALFVVDKAFMNSYSHIVTPFCNIVFKFKRYWHYVLCRFPLEMWLKIPCALMDPARFCFFAFKTQVALDHVHWTDTLSFISPAINKARPLWHVAGMPRVTPERFISIDQNIQNCFRQ